MGFWLTIGRVNPKIVEPVKNNIIITNALIVKSIDGVYMTRTQQ
jgi:hypothetical protein